MFRAVRSVHFLVNEWPQSVHIESEREFRNLWIRFWSGSRWFKSNKANGHLPAPSSLSLSLSIFLGDALRATRWHHAPSAHSLARSRYQIRVRIQERQERERERERTEVGEVCTVLDVFGGGGGGGICVCARSLRAPCSPALIRPWWQFIVTLSVRPSVRPRPSAWRSLALARSLARAPRPNPNPTHDDDERLFTITRDGRERTTDRQSKGCTVSILWSAHFSVRGCVNPASCLPLAAGTSSTNLLWMYRVQRWQKKKKWYSYLMLVPQFHKCDKNVAKNWPKCDKMQKCDNKLSKICQKYIKNVNVTNNWQKMSKNVAKFYQIQKCISILTKLISKMWPKSNKNFSFDTFLSHVCA